jgi:transcriptional regulator with XRE-family HTH domain
MPYFGERLRRLRGSRSQKEVSQDLKIPQTTLSTLENQKSLPRGEVLKKLSDYFSVPASYFFEAAPETTEAAKEWLESLADDNAPAGGIATHSFLQLDDTQQGTIKKVLREKRQAPNKR